MSRSSSCRDLAAFIDLSLQIMQRDLYLPSNGFLQVLHSFWEVAVIRFCLARCMFSSRWYWQHFLPITNGLLHCVLYWQQLSGGFRYFRSFSAHLPHLVKPFSAGFFPHAQHNPFSLRSWYFSFDTAILDSLKFCASKICLPRINQPIGPATNGRRGGQQAALTGLINQGEWNAGCTNKIENKYSSAASVSGGDCLRCCQDVQWRVYRPTSRKVRSGDFNYDWITDRVGEDGDGQYDLFSPTRGR